MIAFAHRIMGRKKRKPSKPEPNIQFGMDRRVLSYMTSELTKNPHVEEGGKYIGYLLPTSDSRLEQLGFDASVEAIVISDFLPSGPNAKRTSIELQPDGEYQERLFRQIEQIDRDVEHVGTWHSHHCNGLRTLSSGDVRGYLRTVNRPEYRLNYFLASLITRLPRAAGDRDWLNHYLFVRGEKEYHKVDGLINMVDWPTRFGEITNHSDDSSKTGVPTALDGGHVSTLNSWYQLAEGKQALAEDKRFFTDRFNGAVAATRRGETITLVGRLESGVIAITYPANREETQVSVTIRVNDAAVLEIKCELPLRTRLQR